jgi:type II restriction/modification system DNA methylase subunit YeeA
VLDPACGSGNFLYLAITGLLDLEKQVLTYAAQHGTTRLPHVQPGQLAGLEINPYAQQLASVVIWIGYLQWKRFNGYDIDRHPVLKPIENIRRMDAILDLSDPERPAEPDWPAAEFIVGNPPFLGGKLLRDNLGDDYVDWLFELWGERVRPEADICCYWFEKARTQIDAGQTKRAGLLATQGIRGGANRTTLQRILECGHIFFAASDRDWILDGANVHISMVGFDGGSDQSAVLDGKEVAAINANLTGGVDITKARRLRENANRGFMGDTKGGAFDIGHREAAELLGNPNPNGRPSSDVVVPWVNGLDVTRRWRDMWMIDFGVDLPEQKAAQYEAPFERIRKEVYGFRQKNNRAAYRDRWWLHVECRPAMRNAFAPLPRFIATARVAKHRLFVWMESPTLPDCQLIAFAFADDYSFGVLHSRAHEVWALKLGTRLETRPRYTPTSCFETFPFPVPTAEQSAAIAAAAKHLDDLRRNWLNPPEWTRTEVLLFPGSADGPWARYVHDPDTCGIGQVRYPRLVAKDTAAAKQLQKRTLTNLYNARPEWLRSAHEALDGAVFAAYGWDPAMSDDELLAALLELNLKRE